jgi:hypothetical protein
MNTSQPSHSRKPQLASFHRPSLLRSGVITLTSILVFTGCAQPRKLIEKREPQPMPECQFIPLESISVTQRDALPGIESNLRKQRTYRLEVKVFEEEIDRWMDVLEQMNTWELWVDSVALPVRFRPMQKKGHLMFSGLRMFYGSSSGGSAALPVETYALHGAALNDQARLVGYNELECYASVLDSLIALPLIVAP